MTRLAEIPDHGQAENHARSSLWPQDLEVLIADDDAAAAELIAEALSALTVRRVSNSDTALQLIRSEAPISLLICSVELPGAYDGIALARQARALRPDLRIIYTSAYRERLPEDDQSRYYGEFLPKPLTVSRVRAAAERALQATAC
jgi:two-component SAPR family response regulator